MRRFICIAMAVLFLATIFSGIAESQIHPGSAGHHIFITLLFISITLVHLALNRKALLHYVGDNRKTAPRT
jgi:hypothetical protein